MNRQKIAQEIVAVAKEMTAAVEVPFSELPPDRQALVKKLRMKPLATWDGIHGYVVQLKAPRMDASDLKKMISDSNFRWMDASGRDVISIGF